MKSLLAKFLYAIVMVEVAAGIICGFLAYFVRSIDPNTAQVFDGLGRPLESTPLLIHLFFNSDSLWPGWIFFFVDLVAFWGGIGIAVWLSRPHLNSRIRHKPQRRRRHKSYLPAAHILHEHR